MVILRDTDEGCVTREGQWSFCMTQVGTCHGKWPVGHLAPCSVSSYGIRLAIASCMQYPHPLPSCPVLCSVNVHEVDCAHSGLKGKAHTLLHAYTFNY